MIKTISVTEAQKKFGHIADEILKTGLGYEVIKDGKPIVKIIPISLGVKLRPALEKRLEKFEKRYDYDLKKLAKH